MKSIEMAFSYYGEFIEDLKVDISLAITLNFCENLRKLCIRGLMFTPDQCHELQHLIEKLQKLEEVMESRTIGLRWRTTQK